MQQFDMGNLSENIDSIAQYDISNNKVFGSAYYVYCNGKTIEKCYGTVSLNTNEPITNASIFRLASMTKPITAVATLILVERGLLSLDDSVDKYLPAFRKIKIIDAVGNTITPKKLPTIRNILSHTSGIVSCPDKQSRMSETDKKTLDNSIAFYVKSGLDFEPNTMQYYSGSSAFDVLTKIIEI
jgi:CubicO group peptidase (beta-lactamase class C family)